MVSNDRRTKSIVKIVLTQLGVGVLVTIIALFVLMYADGDRFNFLTFKIIKTGVVSIDFLPKDAVVYLDNKKVDINKNSFIRNLPPSEYNFIVTKDDYVPWQLDLEVKPSSVNVYKKVVLFYKQPVISELNDNKKIALVNSPRDTLAVNDPNGLYANDYEILVSNKLVARFSTPIKNVVWYYDNAHILYQQGNEIRIMESNGKNDTQLVTLASGSITRFATSSDGTELYYYDNSYKVAKIR